MAEGTSCGRAARVEQRGWEQVSLPSLRLSGAQVSWSYQRTRGEPKRGAKANHRMAMA